MLAMFLAMLETEEDQRRFTKLYETYEKKVYAVALRLDMPAFMLKLVSSVIVALAISVPYLKQQWPTIRRRLFYKKAAAVRGGN